MSIPLSSIILNPKTPIKRKQEFKLDSYVLQEENCCIFVKKAASSEAVGFLNVILERENKAKEFFKDNARVITGTLNGNCIYYPFINLQSLEKLIETSLDNREINLCTEYVSSYIHFLQKLPTVECYPEDFITRFGISPSYVASSARCFTAGPIDCIPSNILVDEASWYVLDHEWFFDFPIPVDFLIYRGIISLICRLQISIQAATNKQYPSVLYDGYGKMRNYIPLVWLHLLQGATTIPLEYLAYWNWLFQKQILLDEKKVNLRLRRNSKHYTKIAQPFIEIFLSESYRYFVQKTYIQKLSNYIINLINKL